jgi:hypothetical protein
MRIVRDPLASDRAAEVPRAQWRSLMEERQRFCTEYLPMDCRHVLFFVEDGQANEWIGYGSRDAYINQGLGLDPEMVEWAIVGLQQLSRTAEQKPVEYEVAAFIGKLAQHGGDRRSEQAKADQACNASLKYGTAAYWASRLDRDRPDLAARVRTREISANAAAKLAGWRRERSAFETICALLPKLSDAECRSLRAELVKCLRSQEAAACR